VSVLRQPSVIKVYFMDIQNTWPSLMFICTLNLYHKAVSITEFMKQQMRNAMCKIRKYHSLGFNWQQDCYKS